MSKKQLLKEKIMIEEKIKKCEQKLKEIEDMSTSENSINNEYEKPMPLYFNKITHKNLNREQSKKYTKMLINKLKNRSNKLKLGKFYELSENITIKKEVIEEIEIPSLEYDDIPSLEYV